MFDPFQADRVRRRRSSASPTPTTWLPTARRGRRPRAAKGRRPMIRINLLSRRGRSREDAAAARSRIGPEDHRRLQPDPGRSPCSASAGGTGRCARNPRSSTTRSRRPKPRRRACSRSSSRCSSSSSARRSCSSASTLIEQLRHGQTGPVHMLDQISRSAAADAVADRARTERASDVTIEGRCMTLTRSRTSSPTSKRRATSRSRSRSSAARSNRDRRGPAS